MNLEKHTPKSREALLTAQNLAKERQHSLLEPSHVLLALIQQPDGIVRAIVTTVAGGVEALRDELSADLDRRPRVHGPNLEFGMTSQTADVLASAERYSRDMQDGYVSTEHLLLALADSSQKKRLADFGLTQSSICAALKAARAARPERTQPPESPYQSSETRQQAAVPQQAAANLTGEEALKTNAQLQRDVQEELNWEPSVTATAIGVSAKDGVITLTGSVPSYFEKSVAEQVVGRVAGVQGIAEELSVKLPTLSERTDTDIAASALNALAWNIAVPTDHAKVRVEAGWITLTGEVEWHFQQVAAENAVVHLMGVKGVTNAISLRPNRVTAAKDIKASIEDAFNRRASSEAREITVTVADGKVTLQGRVRSWRERDEATVSAWAAPGVTAVDNQIISG